MDQFRLYTFVNCIYMNAVQHGIQSTHVLGRLNRKYHVSSSGAAKMLLDWQFKYETVIVLNGGNLKGIRDTYTLLELYADKCGLPFAKFHEDEDSLGGIMTGCGVVLPVSMFGAVDYRNACLHPDGPNVPTTEEIYYYFHGEGVVSAYKETSPEFQIIKAVKSCPLAK